MGIIRAGSLIRIEMVYIFISCTVVQLVTRDRLTEVEYLVAIFQSISEYAAGLTADTPQWACHIGQCQTNIDAVSMTLHQCWVDIILTLCTHTLTSETKVYYQ